MMSRTVYDEICAERDRQDEQWGGPEHDDQHGIGDWCDYIDSQLYKARHGPCEHERERLVKIAALAVAAVESMDRADRADPELVPPSAEEPDWAEKIASRVLSARVPAVNWMATKNELAALLRERFGPCVSVCEKLMVAKYDGLGKEAIVPVRLTVEAQHALGVLRSMRGGKETKR